MTTKITWTNCADEMPPDDATKVISVVGDSKPYAVSGPLVRAEYLRWKNVSYVPVTWTEFTEEKWALLWLGTGIDSPVIWARKDIVK